jgi:ATP-binding cassette subfamily C (CFTR/MRP) protein 4
MLPTSHYDDFVCVVVELNKMGDIGPTLPDLSNDRPPHTVKSPFDDASFLSVIFSWWSIPIIKANKEFVPGKPDTLSAIPDLFSIERNYPRIEAAWDEELKQPKPDYFKALWKAFGRQYTLYSSVLMMNYLSQIAISYIILLLINFLQSDDPVWVGLLYVLAFFGVGLVSSTSMGINMNYAFNIGICVKMCTTMLVYKKTTRLHTQQLGAVGKLINICVNDIDQYEYIGMASQAIMIPFYTLCAMVFLWYMLGYIGLIGIGIIVGFVPLQVVMSRLTVSLRQRVAAVQDERLKLFSNVIEGIRLIKLYAWEIPYRKLLLAIRAREVKLLRSRILILIANQLNAFAGTGITLFGTFAAYVALGNTIEPGQAFAAVSLLLSVQLVISQTFVIALDAVSQVVAGSRRITSLLLIKEKDFKYRPIENPDNDLELLEYSAGYKLTVAPTAKGELKALKQNASFSLGPLTLEVKKGELVIVVGPVGSGKSSLLMSIMGELETISGSIAANDKIAYVEQEPWLTSSPARDNIITNNEFNEDFYQEVIHACCLREDIENMPMKDRTVIGERGLNISGGQKARFSLARAVYADKDLYLLDDPLSALDVHVAKRIFRECIQETLGGKTRILVTHLTNFMKYADRVIVMKDGQVEFNGTYQELTKDTETYETYTQMASESNTEEVQAKTEDVRTIAKEESAKGSVPLKFLLQFLTSPKWGVQTFILILILMVISQVCYMAVPYCVTLWANNDSQEGDLYYNIFGIVVAATFFFGFWRFYALINHIMSCGDTLHKKALKQIFITPVKFFDKNPSGRIINRFSKDVFVLDNALTFMFAVVISMLFLAVGYLIIVIIISPINLAGLAVVSVYSYFMFKWIIPAAREVRKFELISRGPVVSKLTSTIGGLITVRVFKLEDKFIEDMKQLVTVNYKAWLNYQVSNRFFQICMSLGSVVFLTLNSLIVVILTNAGAGATVGLSLSLSGVLMTLVVVFSRLSVEVMNFMPSAQRVAEYSELKSEKNIEGEELEITKGKIEFREVWMRYRKFNDVFVLKGISFTVEGGERVGIVGRTGAGKSSISQVLFMLVPYEKGGIFIDGTEINQVGLHSLRSKLGLIPQMPFLFVATLRYNLDPFSEYSDEQLWEALETVELKKYVSLRLAQGLDAKLSGASAELSVGQKQLLCLARALLRNSTILVMDEATANVDHETDQIIQRTIDRKFKGATILTIAHRLRTVITNDKILVLDNGEVKEFASPAELLENPLSHLSQLVQSTEADEAHFLREVACGRATL